MHIQRIEPPRPALSALRGLFIIAAAGLVLAQGLDGLLTATGLAFLHIVLPLPVVGGWGIAVGLALVLQAGTLSADILLTNAGFGAPARLRVSALGCGVAVLLVVQLMAAFLHFTLLTNLAEGARLTRTLTYDTTTLNTEAAAAEARMAGRYHAAVAQEWTLARLSQAGQDSSGIAGCGPRCKGAIHAARAIEARYAALALPDAGAGTVGASARAGWTMLRQRLDTLRARLPSYRALCTRMGWACRNPLTPILDGAAYRRVRSAMSGRRLADRESLVMAEVARALRRLRDDTAGPAAWQRAAIVGLLPILEFWLILAMRVALVRLRTEAVDQLRAEKERLDAMLDLESQVKARQTIREVMERVETEDH